MSGSLRLTRWEPVVWAWQTQGQTDAWMDFFSYQIMCQTQETFQVPTLQCSHTSFSSCIYGLSSKLPKRFYPQQWELKKQMWGFSTISQSNSSTVITSLWGFSTITQSNSSTVIASLWPGNVTEVLIKTQQHWLPVYLASQSTMTQR